MSLKVYQYKKCSTCVKALKFLKAKGIDFIEIDITETPPGKEELKKMLAFQKGEIKKLFNTSGVVYREMNLSKRMKELSENEAIELLSSNGKLIKRPFLLTETLGVVGFKEEEWKNIKG
ncbi:MAG: arsenate reductase family protein [Nitrospinae bacterium]|nr:arsenate reductase family protein [Nitrospinota bacterium]